MRAGPVRPSIHLGASLAASRHVCGMAGTVPGVWPCLATAIAAALGKPGRHQRAHAIRWLRLSLRQRWYAVAGAGAGIAALAGAMIIAWPGQPLPRGPGGCGLATCTATIPAPATGRAIAPRARRVHPAARPSPPATTRPPLAPPPATLRPAPTYSRLWPPGHRAHGRGHRPHATPTP